MSRGATAWRRAGRGLLFLGVGTFLLLNTTGWLPWAFWLYLLPYWPVMLVALGLRIIFERSRMPWAVLLSPFLVLATMTWVAQQRLTGPQAAGAAVAVHAPRPQAAERWLLDGSLALGKLEVVSRRLAPGDLVRGQARVAHGRPEFSHADGMTVARVRFRDRTSHHIELLRPSRIRSSWDLELSDELPLALDLRLALVGGHLDLAAGPLTGIDIEGAFNDLELDLGRPAASVRIRLDGAFSGYEISVPRNVPVRVETDGFMNLAGDSLPGSGPEYRIHLAGAFNRLTLTER